MFLEYVKAERNKRTARKASRADLRDRSGSRIATVATARRREIGISGDWSAGAALLCAGAIAADGFLDVMGLDRTFTQADQQVSENK